MAKHVSADVSNNDAFDKVVRLQVMSLFTPASIRLADRPEHKKNGQALLMSAPALGLFRTNTNKSESKSLGQFGRKCILIKTRKRITRDGGASILVVNP